VTGTLPHRDATHEVVASALDTGAVPTSRSGSIDLPARAASSVRPWSALICGLPDDGTLLLVDWLLLACREAGIVASAVPLAAGDRSPHGMYVEVAGDTATETELADVPWGAVDLIVSGEHLELVRAIGAGFASPSVTTIISSCRRAFTAAERAVAPQDVLAEREIDALAEASALAYHAFDGPEVAGWYGLPATAQPGLLLGALCGTDVTALDERMFTIAITELGIDPVLHSEGFRRGVRLGRRAGGRVRRTRTAYQFTRRRRAQVSNASRAKFEELVGLADKVVDARYVSLLQDAIFLLTEFQDAAWAERLVDEIRTLVDAERARAHNGFVDPNESIIPDAIRSLAALMVWPDAAWIANRKRRAGRLKELRSAHGISRRDAFELDEYIPLDALDRADATHPRLRGNVARAVPALLQPLRVERIRTTSVTGASRLKRLAASARNRPGSERQRVELDTTASWLEALHDTLRTDHELARIVARSGTLVQGSGAVREAHRATALTFWGRIVRQSIAIDRTVPDGDAAIARLIIPFVWDQLCRSGPLALWEYAAQVLGIALAHARGVSYPETVALAHALCAPRRPVEGA